MARAGWSEEFRLPAGTPEHLMSRSHQTIRKRLLGPVAIVGLALIYTLPFLTIGASGDQIYLKTERIDGESQADGYEKWLEVLSFTNGLSRNVATATRGDSRTVASPSVSEIGITRNSDSASVPLFVESVAGSAQDMTLETVETTPGATRIYRLQLYQVLVSGLTQSYGQGAVPTEHVTLNFTKIEFTYTDDFGGSKMATTGYYDLRTDKGEAEGVSNPGNTRPTISGVPGTNTLEDTAITVWFTIGDSETSSSALNVSASSSNPSVVTTSGILLGGANSSRSATLSPRPDATGTTTITLTVSDGALIQSTSFALTVTPVNDPPRITGLSSQVTDEGMPITIPFSLSDPDTALTNITFNATSTDESLVPVAGIQFGGSNDTRTVTLFPEPGASGSTIIGLSAFDGLDTGSAMFQLTVNPNNPSSPTDILLDNAWVDENASPGLPVGQLMAVDPDSTTHTFTLADSAQSRFSIDGNTLVVANSLLLDHEANASHTIQVTAADPENNSLTRSFTIQVNNVNEAPILTLSGTNNLVVYCGEPFLVNQLQLSDVDAGTNTVSLTLQAGVGTLRIEDPPPGVAVPTNGTSSVTVTATIDELNAMLNSPNGVLYEPPDNLSGLEQLTFTLNDNGHTGSGSPQTVFTSFHIPFWIDRYTQWLRDTYTDEELNNPALETTTWGHNADLDTDRLETLAEYGLGFSPRTNDVERAPIARLVPNGTGRIMTLTLDRRIDPKLSLNVEVAGDLNSPDWSSDPSQLQIIGPTDLGNGFERITYEDRIPETPTSQRYMRLQWILTSP